MSSMHELAMIKQKIDACGKVLRVWGSSKTNPNTKQLKQLQKQLEKLNTNESTEQLRAEFFRVSKALDELLLKQENFWAQRSRISWLRHGDKNIQFFHSKTSQRRQRNHI